MAGASDKARFYLEQSIPELQELERKKLFTKVRPTWRFRMDYCVTTFQGRNILHCKEAVRL